MKIEIEEDFPLSKERFVEGSRRLAREKVLQILNAYEVSEIPWTQQFTHIFNRLFNFGDEGDEDTTPKGRILKPQEVYELEADQPIRWSEEHLFFARKLIEKCIENKTFCDEIIEKNSQNWELDRIANIDKYLIYIAVSELMFFPDIPPKVSINEAIDIAKKYSTDKSSIFINGIMEAFILVFKEKGLLNEKALLLKQASSQEKSSEKE